MSAEGDEVAGSALANSGCHRTHEKQETFKMGEEIEIRRKEEENG